MPRSTAQLVEESHRIGVQFLMADIAAAFTFLDVSETTYSEETRKRNQQNARTAYDTVLRLLPRLMPSEGERTALEAKLAELRSRLIGLGYLSDPENKGPIDAG